MGEEEVESQLQAMLRRAVATSAWLGGEMPTGDFLDLLHYQGIDVYDLSLCWDVGLYYL